MDDKSSPAFSKLIFLLSLFEADLFGLRIFLPKGRIKSKTNFLAFCLEIVLLFTGRRRSSVDPDHALQEALRTRLRVVESNSQDVIQLFKVSQT